MLRMPLVAQVIVLVIVLAGAAGCASLAARDPVQAYVVGIEPLEGEGLELRMLVKLRVQNPNDAPVNYNGVHVALNVQGRPFATGVSDAVGAVPRYGESVISVPVSVSVLRAARSAMELAQVRPGDKVRYELRGKLAGAGLGALRFSSVGEMALPQGLHAREPPAPTR